MSQLIRVVRICLLLAFVFHYKFIAISLVILELQEDLLAYWCRASKNFNFPYPASSVQDFWWHITLYYGLGLSLYSDWWKQKQDHKNIFNLLITMTIAGLWHGAVWNLFFGDFCMGLSYL